MINVSKEFQILMNERTDFKQNAEITFANGANMSLSEKDFMISNNNVVDASSTNGIPLGIALCRSIQIELINDDDRFSTYDFFGAKIRLYLTFQLSETVERIEYGTFTVLTPETYGETVIITALDDMHKADKEYSTSLEFPASIKSMLVEACDILDISLGTTTFLNDDFVVNEKPEDLTFRQLFGYIAMIAGGNVRIDRTGRLRIITYDFANMESIYNSVLNGGKYNPWTNSANLDGGSFAPWDNGSVADGGEFDDRNHFHVLGNWTNLKVDTDDVVITGIQTSYRDEENVENTVIYGVEGYVLDIDNPLIAEKEEDAVALIGNVMVGGRFRQFSGDVVANPTCEFMDTALLLDRKGNVYISFITDVNFQFFGFTSLKNSAEPTLRNSAKSYSEATKTLVKARQLITKERLAREKAVAQLAKDLQTSSGLYMTQEAQEDGSIIYYMHDKLTLAESMIVWKLTALAFGISTDGGETYPYGFTVDGTTITRLLYAEGIDADYINTGAIRITDSVGNELFFADYDSKQVRINADNVKIGSENVQSYINSAISAAKDEIRLEVTQRTSLYNEEVNTLQGGMDGNINLSFFTYGNAVITEQAGKQCIYNSDAIYQDVSIPAGSYLFSYEWLRNLGLYIIATVSLIDMSSGAEIYFKNLGDAWPETDVWHSENFQFTLDKTTRVRFVSEFTAPSGYEDRVNSLYLTNIALYGTAQSVADAIVDMKSELMLQQDRITAEVMRATESEGNLSARLQVTADAVSSRVEKGRVISEINQTAEAVTINANRIDLNGVANAQELIAKYATLGSLEVASADIDYLKVNKLNTDDFVVEYIKGTTISGKSFVGGEVRSTNYKASSSAYTCDSGMRIDLTNGIIWWANGSIKASTGFMNSIGYEVPTRNGGYNLNFKSALAVASANENTLVLGGGYSNVVLPSGANVTSLAEKKTNIIPCANALSAVENTDVYYFNYKNDSVKRDGSQKVGFIIGDDYKLDSRLLSEDGDAIDTYNALALNWRATQQLYDKIKKQQEQINELKLIVNKLSEIISNYKESDGE